MLFSIETLFSEGNRSESPERFLALGLCDVV